MMEYFPPSDRKYSKDHIWIKKDGSRFRIGITHYPVEILGEIADIRLWCTALERLYTGSVTTAIKEDIWDGSPLGAVIFLCPEEGSLSNHCEVLLTSPCNGATVDVNLSVLKNPELIREDPYNHWIIELETYDPITLDRFQDAQSYIEHCRHLEGRMFWIHVHSEDTSVSET